MPEARIHEFPITAEIRELGFSRVHTMRKTLLVYNTRTEPIKCQYYEDDLSKTINKLRKALIESAHFDIKTIEKFTVLLSQVWVKLEEEHNEESPNDNSSANAQSQEGQRINAEIRKLMAENSGITYEKWNEELTTRLEAVRNIAELNFPHSWSGIEFTLSVLKILNISECTLPFAGIILSRAGGNKTLSSGMVIPWPHVYYTRNFTAKAFVSHNTAIKTEKLPAIDMLPKIRFKQLLTPELTPLFSANEDALMENLGIITSVLDGKGYTSHSGAQGRRGYYGNYMFVWIGAAVDIPYRVHKLLAVLGPKLYFFRLARVEKSDQELLDCMNANFEKKHKQVEDAVIDYLMWFEICPCLVEDKESRLLTMVWNSDRDDPRAKDYTVKLGKLLGKLRGHVDIWSSKKATEHEHEYSGYEYSFTDTEDPARAITQLYNLSRGHALLMGRNYITLDDISIIVKVVLSTASVERVAILNLLLCKKGTVTLSKIAKALPMSKSTALKAMTALAALKVVNMDETIVEGNITKQIILREEFNWLFSDEFINLRQGFNPVDNSAYDAQEGDGDEKEAIFWHRFMGLEQKSSDKIVKGDELRATLISSGKFYQSDAALFVEDMIKSGELEAVRDRYDAYRRGERGA